MTATTEAPLAGRRPAPRGGVRHAAPRPAADAGVPPRAADHLRSRAGRDGRPGRRADRRPADHRPRAGRRAATPTSALVTPARPALRRRRPDHRIRDVPDERPPLPDDGDGAGRAAGPRLPARARPLGAAPAGRAAGLAGLPRHQRRRPAHHVHAVGRGPGPGQRRPARRRHRGHGRLLLAAHAAGLRLLPPAGHRRPLVRRGAWRPRTAWSASGSATCSAPSRSPSSAPRSIRAYGVGARTAARIDAAIDRQYRAQVDAQRVAARGLRQRRARRRAGQRRGGRRRRAAGRRPATSPPARWSAFLFLVTLFVAPVQIASEVLNEAQNAVAGLRRVLGVLDTAPDVADPAIADPERVHELPAGPMGVRFDAVVLRATPGGPTALQRRRPRPSSRGSGWRSWGRPAGARRPSPSWSPGSWTPSRAGCCCRAGAGCRWTRCGSPRCARGS